MEVLRSHGVQWQRELWKSKLQQASTGPCLPTAESGNIHCIPDPCNSSDVLIHVRAFSTYPGFNDIWSRRRIAQELQLWLHGGVVGRNLLTLP